MSSGPNTIIGAGACCDPKLSNGVPEMAHVPSIQQAAFRGAGGAAVDIASSGAVLVKHEFLEVKAYIQESNCSLKILCFCNALALLVSSILGFVNVFAAGFKPMQYLWAAYNILFAFAIIVMDGKPEWFKRCGDLQRRMYNAAPILASQAGRAAFYIYVGSMNLVMLPDSWWWKLVYVVIGASLCGAGLMLIFYRCRRGCSGPPRGEASASQV